MFDARFLFVMRNLVVVEPFWEASFSTTREARESQQTGTTRVVMGELDSD